jgi:hypothetical protein
VRHGHPHAKAQAYHDSIAQEGRWLLSAAIRTDSEDADVRNLLVRAGAQEISSVANGTMVAVVRPDEGYAKLKRHRKSKDCHEFENRSDKSLPLCRR